MFRRLISLLLVTTGLFALGAGLLLFDGSGMDAPVVKAAPAQISPQATLTDTGSVTEGAYIVSLALGCGCHFNPTPPPLDLRGGEEFVVPPFGTAYARNITPHPETGIGNYTPEELETVLRTGKRRTGEQLFPAMPYMQFSHIAEDDMADLIAFLLNGQTPVSNTVPARTVLVPPPPFTPTVSPPATAPVSGTARGEYILTALADCVGCHGPNLAGSPGFAPNITSDPNYGLGSLTAEQIAAMLETGARPNITDSVRFDGSAIGSIMGQLIQFVTTNWTSDDQLAVAQYLQTVPAVGNQPPGFGSEPLVSATVGVGYVYTATVADVDVTDTLTVTAPVKPDWLTLGPTLAGPGRLPSGAAVLSGTAALSDTGPANVVLVVTSASGATATQTFTITVTPRELSLPVLRKPPAK